jgi:5-methylcytosine-specific restriction endonuclease McrA
VKNHVKIYLREFGKTKEDFIPCEICGAKAVDIHHINARGMGGDPQGKKDVIENLMALCRSCHIEYGDIKEFKEHLKAIHQIHIGSIHTNKTA